MMFVRRTIPTIPTVPTFTAILRFTALLACVLQTSAAAQDRDTAAAPNIPAPNILVIVIDDLG